MILLTTLEDLKFLASWGLPVAAKATPYFIDDPGKFEVPGFPEDCLQKPRQHIPPPKDRTDDAGKLEKLRFLAFLLIACGQQGSIPHTSRTWRITRENFKNNIPHTL
jgi:hypothetical protein